MLEKGQVLELDNSKNYFIYEISEIENSKYLLLVNTTDENDIVFRKLVINATGYYLEPVTEEMESLLATKFSELDK